MSIRTRLRLSARDEEILSELGRFLSQLATRDLAERVFLGVGHTREDFARRKREISALSSSRWAGTITRGSNDQWALARRAQAAHLDQLEQVLETLEKRLAVPVDACDIKTRIKGYPTQAVRSTKQARHQHLTAVAAAVRADLRAGIVRVVRGGKDLLRNRLHLAAAGLDETVWRQRWYEARIRIEADGEAGKRFGNQSIQVSPDGAVLVKLPGELAHKYADRSDQHGRYRLDATCSFAYRNAEWAAQVAANRAVGYSIGFRDGRCYLNAAFTPARPDLPEDVDDETLMKAALACGVIGIDHNADHLAAWRLDVHGNPVGRPGRIDIDYTGTTDRRNAQVRQACSELIHSSRWGRQYWCKASSTKVHKTSGHDAAALVLGRRGQGLGARRRAEKTVSRKKTEAARIRCVETRPGAGTEDHRPPASVHQPTLPAHPGPETAPRTTHPMCAAEGPRPRSSPPSTVRDGPPRRVPDQGLTHAQR
ncbi:transposase [Streptomyces sp. CB01635]|uniref:transposase n=1 Tax=unclassified Streptomyces TaxID=2593676 RepID=UPI000C275752|nr:transposase [Streptomyces sp. CB01635]PJN11403.1 transposase [Streptomyces sp. CB01635]